MRLLQVYNSQVAPTETDHGWTITQETGGMNVARRLWYLLLGSSVADSHQGKLTGIEVDTEGWKVTGITIREGFLRRQERRFPSDMIRSADPSYVRLMIGTPGPLPAAKARLTEDTRIVDRQGQPLGSFIGVRVNVLGRSVTHVMLVSGVVASSPRLLPVGQVAGFDGRSIVIDADAEAIERLPEYRPDDEIRREVRQALFNSPDISDVDYYAITVEVEDGVVHLAGNVRSSTVSEAAEITVRQLPYVLDLHNEIIDDIELEEMVGRALAEHPETRSARFTIRSRNGNVIIRGFAPSQTAVQSASRIAASVRGVRNVKSEVTVVGQSSTEPSAVSAA